MDIISCFMLHLLTSPLTLQCLQYQIERIIEQDTRTRDTLTSYEQLSNPEPRVALT